MMTLSYNIGLVIGSIIGWVFDKMLGEQIPESKLCPSMSVIRPTLSSVISSTSSSLLSNSVTILSNITSSISSSSAAVTQKPLPNDFVSMITSTISPATINATAQLLYESSTDSYTEMTELVLLSTTTP